MKNKLFWRLCTFIGLGTVLLFWAIDWLTNHTETSMSFIDQHYQQQLFDYGKKAEKILVNEGEEALAEYIETLQATEQTWVAVVRSDITPFADTSMLPAFIERFQYGRSPEWKIHLYFAENPVMEVPFVDKSTHFLIQLPQRMRPGGMLMTVRLLLQIALPLILLSALSYLLYRHVMGPLKQLEKATNDFSQGLLDVRVTPALSGRNDELTRLANTFDKMAKRTSSLIINQRSLLADLSHELRTPLTRIDMALDFVEQGISPEQALERLRYEAATMRELAEDTLTYAWLDTELPSLRSDNFDLTELLNVICDDARFEYPHHTLSCQLPDTAPITNSSQLALGQAIENIIRNALRYTPAEGEVSMLLKRTLDHYSIVVSDEGQGVPDDMLTDIFKPFFRVDKARSSSNASSTHGEKRTGFGLGLALAQRQITAVGGTIHAANITDSHGSKQGLKMQIILPA